MPKRRKALAGVETSPVELDPNELWLVRVYARTMSIDAYDGSDVQTRDDELYVMSDRDNVIASIAETWSTTDADLRPRISETINNIHVWSRDGMVLFIHARRLTPDFVLDRPTHF